MPGVRKAEAETKAKAEAAAAAAAAKISSYSCCSELHSGGAWHCDGCRSWYHSGCPLGKKMGDPSSRICVSCFEAVMGGPVAKRSRHI